MSNKKKCIVSYKTIVKKGEVNDYRFGTLKQCCTTFGEYFNERYIIKVFDGENEINFVGAGAGTDFILHLSPDMLSSEDIRQSCPYCDAVIELKEIPL